MMSDKKAVKDHSFIEYCTGREIYIRFCRTYVKVTIESLLNTLHNEVGGGDKWLEIEVSQLSVFVERIVYNKTLINPEYKLQL